MNVILQRAGEHDAYIRRSRTEICGLIGLQPEGHAVEPVPYGLYLFVFDDGSEPAGMAEFYFYDEDDYRRCFYDGSRELKAIAPLSELIHVRSLYMGSEKRKSIRFLYLVAALVDVAHALGARYMTAGTSVDNDYILGLHATAGMRKVGAFEVDGSLQQLSLMDLTPMAIRARTLRRRAQVTIERGLAAELALRGSGVMAATA
jgi:hypothetical protein